MAVAAVLVAAASFYLGYQAIEGIRTSRTVFQNLFEEYRLNEAKRTDLEKSLSELNLSREKETVAFKTEIKRLQEAMTQNTRKMEDIKVDQNLMQSVFRDIKESSQKTLKSFNSLEQRLQQLEGRVSQTEGNLRTWEKSPMP